MRAYADASRRYFPQQVVVISRPGAIGTIGFDEGAIMVTGQVREYLEHGNVVNAVNFPAVTMARESPWRVAIANANVPNAGQAGAAAPDHEEGCRGPLLPGVGSVGATGSLRSITTQRATRCSAWPQALTSATPCARS